MPKLGAEDFRSCEADPEKYASQDHYGSYIPALEDISLFSGIPPLFGGRLFGFLLATLSHLL